MANITKIIMPESIAAPPVPGRRFLNELPIELRLSVYEYFFEGSKVRATLAETTKSSSAGGPKLILRHSEHFKLLLTCRTIYNEALATYWSKTVLRLQCPPMVFNRPSQFQQAKHKVDTYARRLCTSLPEVAKENLRHIRGMVLPALKSVIVEENPSLTASALLGTFKNLATCEMTPTLAHSVDGLVSHTLDPEKKGFSRFTMAWGGEPTHWLASRYGIDATAGVTFFFKGAIMFSMSTDEASRSASRRHSLPQFRNFSTGIAFEDATRKLDDEEGYEKVMQTNV